MATFDIGSKDELRNGTMAGKTAGGQQILVANIDGQFYAMGDVCTHMGVCNLSEGFLDSDQVECYCHGSIFNVKTGQVVSGPATTPEPVYPVTIHGDRLFVDIQ
ncbi:Rieske (2Fe-2S) protein [Dehalogenimonas etheniformans]|uniref:Non-heme iron oxygenase ferredoxin subunit n=1 Tax=Dehalogenimonas etheniformans TaxID=1536648 RepID=A0A2P5P992_9CHLR|nr:non-heme iron oxygenase ferredoxin subunit [Dehalogenimonas etheniformans]PPD58850.1 non-heme iron oxygenase ferredoxin subunit [Dehalogenimonas etheniformans]QNT76382.1 non-heme iron oxygenase ferredoxin subunit [Dehalogenimonas etheniformans]